MKSMILFLAFIFVSLNVFAYGDAVGEKERQEIKPNPNGRFDIVCEKKSTAMDRLGCLLGNGKTASHCKYIEDQKDINPCEKGWSPAYSCRDYVICNKVDENHNFIKIEKDKKPKTSQ